jgi:hypothetical protein
VTGLDGFPLKMPALNLSTRIMTMASIFCELTTRLGAKYLCAPSPLAPTAANDGWVMALSF